MKIRARLYYDGRYYMAKVKEPGCFSRFRWVRKTSSTIVMSTDKQKVTTLIEAQYGGYLEWENPKGPPEWVSA